MPAPSTFGPNRDLLQSMGAAQVITGGEQTNGLLVRAVPLELPERPA